MNNSPDKNQSGTGWHCSHCGAFNKVVAAKFCGKCGSVKENPCSQPVLKTEEPPKDSTTQKSTIANYRVIFKHLKKWLIPTSNVRIFKRLIASAILLLLTSVLTGYKMYTNVNIIRLSKSRFKDVAIDHPVYSVCKNLLNINAISFRKNLELAPYEKISAAEWNYVLYQASKHLNQKYSEAAYFSKNDPISVDNLNNKLRALNSNTTEILDTSRIQSFYLLEQALFN